MSDSQPSRANPGHVVTPSLSSAESARSRMDGAADDVAPATTSTDREEVLELITAIEREPRDTNSIGRLLTTALRIYSPEPPPTSGTNGGGGGGSGGSGYPSSSPAAPPPSPRVTHPLCDRCSDGGEGGRAFHALLHTCLLRLLSFKERDEVARWLQMLSLAILGCDACYKGYVQIQKDMPARFLHCFSPESQAGFTLTLRRWEEGQALSLLHSREIKRGTGLGGLSPSELYAVSSLVGVLMGTRAPGAQSSDLVDLFRSAATSHKLLQEANPGLLAMALEEGDDAAQGWASVQIRAPLREMHQVWADTEPLRKLVEGRLRTSRNWDAYTFVLRAAPCLATLYPALTATVLRHLSDPGEGAEVRSIFRAFRTALQAAGPALWRATAGELSLVSATRPASQAATSSKEEWPLVVLSSALDNPGFSDAVADSGRGDLASSTAGPSQGASSSRPNRALFDWMPAMLETLWSSSVFETATKRIVNYLLETMQRSHLHETSAVGATCMAVGVDLLIHFFGKACEPSPSQSDPAPDPRTEMQQTLLGVVELYANTITLCALQGKLPHAASTLPQGDACRAKARQLLELVLRHDVDRVKESLLGLSKASRENAKLWSRKARTRPGTDDAGGRDGANGVGGAKGDLSVDQIFERAAYRTQYPTVTVCSQLWKEAFRAFRPGEDANLFLRPLAPLFVFSDPTLDVHLLPEPAGASSPAFSAYRDKVKASVVSIARSLRVLRGSVASEILFEIIDDGGSGRELSLHRLCTEAADGLMAANLCPLPEIHKAAQNVVRAAFEVAETREDCFRYLLQSSPELALRGLGDFLDDFVRSASLLVEANETAKWMVRSLSDVLAALCSPVDGLLRAGSPVSLLANAEGAAALQRRMPRVWELMNRSIAAIFAHTQAWSKVLSRRELVAWFRDVTLFASEAVDQVWAVQKALVSSRRTTATEGSTSSSDKAASVARTEKVGPENGVVAVLAEPLDKARMWLRINEMEIVQETRAYMLKAIDCFTTGQAKLPTETADKILAFLNQQLEIKEVPRRSTLLSTADLLDFRAHLTAGSSTAEVIEVSDSEEDKDTVGRSERAGRENPAPSSDATRSHGLVTSRLSIDDGGSRQKLGRTSSGKYKQAKLSFGRVDQPQPFVSSATARPAAPTLDKYLQQQDAMARQGLARPQANAFRNAGSSEANGRVSSKLPTSGAPPAPPPSRPSGKLGQLRQTFQQQQQGWRASNAAARASSGEKNGLIQAPVARNSAHDNGGLANAAAAAADGSGKPVGTVPHSVISSDEESESDSDDGDEAVVRGLAALVDKGGAKGPKSPIKMRKSKPQGMAPQVPRRAVLLQDPQIEAARLAKAEAERKRRLRAQQDLSPLHRSLLSWDFYAEGDVPPTPRGAPGPDYAAVPDTFESVEQYSSVFGPMLLLECWASFVQAREQVTSSSASANREPATSVVVVGRSSVDSFVDVNANVVLEPGQRPMDGSRFSDTDVVFLREKSGQRDEKGRPRTVLAKVEAFRAQPQGTKITLRCCLASDHRSVGPALVSGSQWEIGKLFPLTTLHREFVALMTLGFFDLLAPILSARGSPDGSAARVQQDELQQAMSTYGLNQPQAEAVLGSMASSRGFSLVQGPPGTGKTKTICSLVAHFIATRRKAPSAVQPGRQGSSAREPKKKILLCAPSNAAIDEVVKRACRPFRTSDGRTIVPSVVRVGRDEMVNVAVKELSLDNQVEKRLSTAATDANREGAETAMDPTTLHAEIRRLRSEKDAKLSELQDLRTRGGGGGGGGGGGSSATIGQLEAEVKVLTMRRMEAMSKLDDAKDRRQAVSRQQDADRKRVQLEILADADVVCTTLAGAGHPLLASLPFDFETVIIDEAAQAVELSSLIPLRYGCTRCILVGDPNQLPPTVISQKADRLRYSQSLFVRMFKQRGPVHLLSIQYRMHPAISELPSKTFYDGLLKDGPNMAQLTEQPWHKTGLLAPFKFFDARRGEERAARGHSVVNAEEAQIAASIYARLRQEAARASQDLDSRVGVVTMYKEQVFEIKRTFFQRFGRGVEEVVDFNTVDGFQGQEKDIVILSCVRSKGLGFITDRRRVNVAITRAKSNMFIVGKAQLLRTDGTMWASLIQQAEQRGALQAVTPESFRQQAVVPALSPVGLSKKGRSAPKPNLVAPPPSASGATSVRRAQPLGPKPPPAQPRPPSPAAPLEPSRRTATPSLATDLAKRQQNLAPAPGSKRSRGEAIPPASTEEGGANGAKTAAHGDEAEGRAGKKPKPMVPPRGVTARREGEDLASAAVPRATISAAPPRVASAIKPGSSSASTNGGRGAPSSLVPPGAPNPAPPPPPPPQSRPPSAGPSKEALSALFVSKKRHKPGARRP